MYSGYNLVYGIKINKKYLQEKYLIKDIHIDNSYDLLVKFVFENIKIDLENYNDMIMDEPITFITKQCCYDNDEIFIGMTFANIESIYRDDVEEYDNIIDYFEEINNSLFNTMKNFYEFKKQIDKDLELIFDIDESFRQIPKIYRCAKSCETCIY